jgi:uncharacterized protein YfiM (DUF2279 family)
MSVVLALSLVCGALGCAAPGADSNAGTDVAAATDVAAETTVAAATGSCGRTWSVVGLARDRIVRRSDRSDQHERADRRDGGDRYARGDRADRYDLPDALPQAARDPWFASDKLRHFLTAFAVTGYAHAGLRALDLDNDAAVTGGIVVSLAAGIGKEIHDVRAGSFFSLRDMVWDVAGTLVGAALVAQAR